MAVHATADAPGCIYLFIFEYCLSVRTEEQYLLHVVLCRPYAGFPFCYMLHAHAACYHIHFLVITVMSTCDYCDTVLRQTLYSELATWGGRGTTAVIGRALHSIAQCC
jgi:hypothetical protein